jgi:hypothetical protein
MSPLVEYEDFVVQVGPGRGDAMTVRVLASPAGQGEGSFTPPWTSGEWPRLRASWWSPCAATRAICADVSRGHSRSGGGECQDFLVERQRGARLGARSRAGYGECGDDGGKDGGCPGRQQPERDKQHRDERGGGDDSGH